MGHGGEALITEEQREDHCHILGTTREGKSKFLEYMIREDISRGNGLCLLDPSDRGDTVYNVLRYCASIGYEKVCLIDPYLLRSHKRVACIQPFHAYHKASSVGNVWNTLQVLFESKDINTPQMKRYMTALLRVLWDAEMTPYESVYFSDFHNKMFMERRREIFSLVDPTDRNRITLESIFNQKSAQRFDQLFSSTVNRLDPIWEPPLSYMLGADVGVNFPKMVADGWVILVNLFSGGGMDEMASRLLGITVINELIFAIERLRRNQWKGVYYLYVDEAGLFVNQKLLKAMAYMGKSGVRVTIAHHYFDQFELPAVREGVKQLTKLKIMMNTPGYRDRDEMIKSLGYGGKIHPELASYANSDLPKRTAIVKVGKDHPKRIKFPDVPSVALRRNVEQDFLNKLTLYDFCHHRADIQEQFEARFTPKADSPCAASGKASHRPSTSKAPVSDRVPEGEHQSRVQADDVPPKSPPKRRPIKI